jgi:hypothetical protein
VKHRSTEILAARKPYVRKITALALRLQVLKEVASLAKVSQDGAADSWAAQGAFLQKPCPGETGIPGTVVHRMEASFQGRGLPNARGRAGIVGH